MQMKLRQAIKWHGGKSYLARRIVELMPTRARNPNSPSRDDPGWVHYVEPFFGGGAVLFAMDPDGISEVVNDLHGALINFWRVLANEDAFDRLVRRLQATPCSKPHFLECREHAMTGDAVEDAAAFFVVNRQSRQAIGKDFSTIVRNRTRRGMNELSSAWWSAIDGLPEIHQRLKRVVVLQDDALKVIKQQDGPRTLSYCDPPYLHETRTATDVYQHEMSIRDHEILLETLGEVQGRFLLSGYRSDLYDRFAADCGWSRVEIEIPNHASGKGSKERKTECVWMNDRPSA